MALTGDRLQRVLNQYDTALQGAEDKTIARINAALESAAKKLESELTKSYQRHSGRTDLLPSQRSLLILQEVQEYRALLNPGDRAKYEQEFEALLSTGSQYGLDMSAELIKAVDNDALKGFASVPIEAVRFQAQDATTRLYRWSDEYQSKISGIVEMHLATGSGPRKVATALRNELGIAKGRAEAIARTESISSFDSATRANYKRNEISYVQRIASGADGKVCGYCADRAGRVYRLEDAVAVLHARCRCVLAPYDPKWAALGLIDNGWIEKHAAEVRADTVMRGEPLKSGPAPFERANNVPVPKAIWNPGQPLPKLPTPATKAKPVPQDAMTLDNLMKIGRDRIKQLGDNPDIIELARLKNRLMKALPEEQAIALANEATATDAAFARIPEEALVDYLQEFHRMTGGNMQTDITFIHTGSRSWADPSDHVINIGSKTKESIFHELGHFLEADNPAIAEASRQWLASKATGTAKTLRELTGNDVYPDSEIAIPGNFFSPYVGKVYENGLTEVISMGVQNFTSAAAMKRFLDDDPDHFAYIVGVLEVAQKQNRTTPPVKTSSQKQSEPATASERLFEPWNGYRALTPVEAEMLRTQNARTQEFSSYLKREEESIRRRTSGEIDRKLREYYDAEAAALRKKLGIPSPKTATKPAPAKVSTNRELDIQPQTAKVKPVKIPAIDVDESTLDTNGKAALKVVKDYQQVLADVNEAIAKIPASGKTLPADAYDRLYGSIDSTFNRLTDLVNQAKALTGKVDHPELTEKIRQIGTISKESLPGYKIAPVSDDILKRSASRPC